MSTPLPSFARLIRQPVLFVACGFGAGLSPKAPGTVGSVVGLALYWPLCHLPWAWYLAVVAAGFVAGIWICDEAARSLGVHDHPGIVWDEIVGVLVTLAIAPVSLYAAVAGFALFRFFDILKPWPVRVLDQQVHGGLGIMLDDLLAAVMALAVLEAGIRVLG